MASPQVEGKFVRQQEKYSSIEKKELGELDKNVLLLLFIPTPLLNSFCCILEPPFINTPLLIRDRRVVALRKISH